MPIDRSKWKERYVEGTSRSGDKLVENYVATPDKVARMASDSAQGNFESAMKDPKVLKRRQTKLRQLSEGDLNEAMRAKGSIRYAEGTAAGADKALERVEPYLSVIDSEVSKLPPRTRDAYQNVMKRVAPIAVALQKKKESMT